MAADSEISRLTRSSALSKATRKTWSLQPAEEEEDGDEEGEQPHVKFLPSEGGIPSQLKRSESELSSALEGAAEQKQSDATQTHLSFNLDTSTTSVRSTDTTLEYFDAPLSINNEEKDGHVSTEKDDDDDVVTVNVKFLAEKEPAATAEVMASPATEKTLPLTSEDSEKEEDDVREENTPEDVMEVDLDQEAKTEEEIQSNKEDDLDVESSTKQDAAIVDQNETSIHLQGNLFLFVFIVCFFRTDFWSRLHCTEIQNHDFENTFGSTSLKHCLTKHVFY